MKFPKWWFDKREGRTVYHQCEVSVVDGVIWTYMKGNRISYSSVDQLVWSHKIDNPELVITLSNLQAVSL